MSKSGKKLSEWISDFIKLEKQVEREYKFSYESVHKEDLAIQDYMHQLENSTAKDRGKIATAFANSRKERRKNKDIVFIAEPFVEWIERNKDAIKDLERTLGEVRHRESRESVYYPRILDEPPTETGRTPQYMVKKIKR